MKSAKWTTRVSVNQVKNHPRAYQYKHGVNYYTSRFDDYPAIDIAVVEWVNECSCIYSIWKIVLFLVALGVDVTSSVVAVIPTIIDSHVNKIIII